MPNFVVSYDLPYRHQVSVGVSAKDEAAAITAAEAALDDGTLWDNTPKIPLLMDLYDEDSDSGEPFVFTAEQTTEPYQVHESVTLLEQDKQAVAVCKEIARFADQVHACRSAVDADDLTALLRKVARMCDPATEPEASGLFG